MMCTCLQKPANLDTNVNAPLKWSHIYNQS